MTTATETVKTAKQPGKGPDKASSAASSGAISLAALILCAIVSWLAGLALHRGFGMSVPFLAGFFLLVAFAFFLRLVVLIVASGWFEAASGYATEVAMKTVIGAFIAETELRKAQDAGVLQHMSKRIEDMSAKDGGGYL